MPRLGWFHCSPSFARRPGVSSIQTENNGAKTMNIEVTLREAMLLRWACRNAIEASQIIHQHDALEAMVAKLNIFMWLYIVAKEGKTV